MLMTPYYYMIIPHTELTNLLNEYGIVSHDGYDVWESVEGVKNQAESTAIVKLLYLAYFRTALLRLDRAENRHFLDTMMGQPPFTVETFDKWWDIKRLHRALQFKTDPRQFDPQELDLLTTTNLPSAAKVISRLRNMPRPIKPWDNLQR